MKITATTICRTNLHIVCGEYPVQPGLIIGHEPVGVIEELGAGVTGYSIVTSLCPGGKERMRRLINIVQSGRFAPTMLMIHKFSLLNIKDDTNFSESAN